jgi:hypothetical protein
MPVMSECVRVCRLGRLNSPGVTSCPQVTRSLDGSKSPVDLSPLSRPSVLAGVQAKPYPARKSRTAELNSCGRSIGGRCPQ